MPADLSTGSSRRPPGGVTLVELLAVIAILAGLMAILLPALQGAREAARRAQCGNNLRQMGQACLSHEQSFRHYPTGGWGWGWMGDPDLGFGLEQPGGWVYNVLPFLDQSPLRDHGSGEAFEQKRESRVKLVTTPLAIFNCPTRRPAALFTYQDHSWNRKFNMRETPRVARGDYAVNAGSQPVSQIFAGPATLEQGLSPSFGWPSVANHNGISFQRSMVPVTAVRDGTSTTYLAGERYLNPDAYHNGNDAADNSNLYTGYENDNHRCASQVPTQDRPGLVIWDHFGSAHIGICQFVFCDGSVRAINFTIDPETHRRLGNRQDRLPIDPLDF